VNHPLREGWTSQVEIDGRVQRPGKRDESRIRPVSPDYFRATGTPLLRGRPIEARDRQGAPLVVVVNEAFARRYFEREDPLHHAVNFWGKTREIVGVVRDVRFRGLGRESEPAVYPSLLQVPISEISIVLRGGGDPAALAPLVRQAVRSVDPDVALFQVRAAEDLLAESLGAPRFQTTLLSLFGGAALLLSALGLYGLLAYSVARRTREIGIRIALGAQRADLARMIVGEGLGRCLAGLAAGGVASLAASRLLAGLLHGVRPADPVVLAGVFGTLLAAAIAASSLPALRAARMDPMVALRME
jgi:putative ABC transport system permease protein